MNLLLDNFIYIYAKRLEINTYMYILFELNVKNQRRDI